MARMSKVQRETRRWLANERAYAAALCEAARHIAQQQATPAPAPEPTPALGGAEIDRRMAAAFRA